MNTRKKVLRPDIPEARIHNIEDVLNIGHKDLKNLFGHLDSNIKLIENECGVRIVSRSEGIKVLGPKAGVERSKAALSKLTELSLRGEEITEQSVRYCLSMGDKLSAEDVVKLDSDRICNTIQGKPIKPKTMGQKEYVDAMRRKMIIFGVGPAGTGKTYLAMAMAITAFQKEEVSRIILTRPAIEAGEKLGFLPGDLQSKVDPYLRPLYDALYQIMGAESFMKNLEKGLIEVAPLAYMRGRTLDNAFIILDEAQNTTPSQMKMFLTRIGFGSKAVITGDQTQKDLPKDMQSGLDVAMDVLKRLDDIAFCRLTGDDVVRHPLVQRIVMAYEDYEREMEKKQSQKYPSKRGKPN